MTLRELLKQNELRVVEVAAGADGLARTISGAVMFDNPEMVNWMRAGEIMLTTGYFLLDDPVKQEKVLRDLADSGSGGLVIKMKRYFHEIPPAMLQLADELHFPLMLQTSTTIYALAFVEGGNAWTSVKKFNPFDMKRSAGVGARIYLPMVGMMGIDWAYGFDRVNGEKGGSHFHFILGQEF